MQDNQYSSLRDLDNLQMDPLGISTSLYTRVYLALLSLSFMIDCSSCTSGWLTSLKTLRTGISISEEWSLLVKFCTGSFRRNCKDERVQNRMSVEPSHCPGTVVHRRLLIFVRMIIWHSISVVSPPRTTFSSRLVAQSPQCTHWLLSVTELDEL